jgi:hypothetical protein
MSSDNLNSLENLLKIHFDRLNKLSELINKKSIINDNNDTISTELVLYNFDKNINNTEQKQEESKRQQEEESKRQEEESKRQEEQKKQEQFSKLDKIKQKKLELIKQIQANGNREIEKYKNDIEKQNNIKTKVEKDINELKCYHLTNYELPDKIIEYSYLKKPPTVQNKKTKEYNTQICDEINKIYRKEASQIHPDKNKDCKEQATKAFNMLKERHTYINVRCKQFEDDKDFYLQK